MFSDAGSVVKSPGGIIPGSVKLQVMRFFMTLRNAQRLNYGKSHERRKLNANCLPEKFGPQRHEGGDKKEVKGSRANDQKRSEH